MTGKVTDSAEITMDICSVIAMIEAVVDEGASEKDFNKNRDEWRTKLLSFYRVLKRTKKANKTIATLKTLGGTGEAITSFLEAIDSDYTEFEEKMEVNPIETLREMLGNNCDCSDCDGGDGDKGVIEKLFGKK